MQTKRKQTAGMSRSLPENQSAISWRISADRILQLSSSNARATTPSAHALIMAIINVTPDSFSDGAQHNDLHRACAFAQLCIDDGARILDIGGESTRPGAVPVSVDEQIA
ncbi:MAG: dihydropteroate synthase, partial [Planctomycetota bacterium]